MVDDEETTFEMSQKQTILDAALKQGIDAPILTMEYAAVAL
jgi:ring-1,2-phenylacetyl-CoA epoxidase subunit PaaE